jgi:hypothetical protein
MDQITLVERELLELGVPATVPTEELRRLAKDILWQTLEMKSVQTLTASLGNIQMAYELHYSQEACESAAAAIWEMAHDEKP